MAKIFFSPLVRHRHICCRFFLNSPYLISIQMPSTCSKWGIQKPWRHFFYFFVKAFMIFFQKIIQKKRNQKSLFFTKTTNNVIKKWIKLLIINNLKEHPKKI
jgi:hypothetical protein